MMNLADRTARRARAAALIASGMRYKDVAKLLGVTPDTIRADCLLTGTVRPKKPYARSVHESMDDPRWEGMCLYRRATDEACTKPATRYNGQCLACDDHAEAMGCRDYLPRALRRASRSA